MSNGAAKAATVLASIKKSKVVIEENYIRKLHAKQEEAEKPRGFLRSSRMLSLGLMER